MSKKGTKKDLSEKQKKFCREYLKHFNASTAAISAGYSRKTARQSGYQLLTNIYIQTYLANLINKQAEKAELSVEWIIKELKQLYERCQSSLSSPGAIAGATKQLELLGKHLAMFTDKIKVDNGLERLLKEIEDESERGLPSDRKNKKENAL